MEFALSESQHILKNTAREFLTKECSEGFIRAMEQDEKGYSPSLWYKIAELGWLGMVFPEKYGGLGCSIADLAILYEEFGRAMLPGPHLSTVLCGLIISAVGDEAQKAAILPKISGGDLIMALSLTEPDASWEPDGIRVSATPDKDCFIIDGMKLFVHDVQAASKLVCVARTTDSFPEGVTLFLIDRDNPGVSYRRLKTMAGNHQYEVVFNKAKVPHSSIVGELHHGWTPVSKVLQQGAVLLCEQMVGAGRRIVELTLEYARTRVQFDQPIGVNQHVQEHCVQQMAAVDGSAYVTCQAAWKLGENMPCDFEVAVAKAWTGEAMEKACWHAHQVFAGVGYTTEIGVLPLYTKRARGHQVYLGDSSHWRKKISQHMDGWVLEMPRGKPLGISVG